MRVRIGLLIAISLTVSIGVALADDSALAIEDLDLRAAELGMEMRAEVEAQVRAQAAMMKVEVPVAELTDLLFAKAFLELDRDRCGFRLLEAEVCRRVGRDLAAVEADFLRLAALSADEFKSGRRGLGGTSSPVVGGRRPTRAGGRPPAKGLSFPGGSDRSDPEYCECSVSVASRDRWINRYWGLECNGHASHGVCSGNVDSWHSSGAGAMTGTIYAFFGGDIRARSCPDDHRTCFKGPMASKPGGGEWGNVCNCDTTHSQFSNPFGSWYGGDLSDAELVFQASFPGMIVDGPCGSSSMAVQEFVKENDPVCCDDPMGTLSANVWIADGTNVTEIPTSAQNCNGGSQSGVPPFCGTFGATIRVQTTCQTRADDSFASCSGRCGEMLPDATCHCDFGCQQAGDCCFDYCDACSAQGDSPPFECSFGQF